LQADEAALFNDRQLHPVDPVQAHRGYPRWAGSEAQRLLKVDIDNRVHETMQTRHFYQTRPEYQQSPLKVFRNHIQQERRSRVETPYWAAKRARAAARRAERAARRYAMNPNE